MYKRFIIRFVTALMQIFNFFLKGGKMKSDKGERELMRGAKVVCKKIIIKMSFKPFSMIFDKKIKYDNFESIDVVTEDMNIKLSKKKN